MDKSNPIAGMANCNKESVTSSNFENKNGLKAKDKKSVISSKAKEHSKRSSEILKILPTCQHSDKGFRCAVLSKEDITNFQKRFYERELKVNQDIFILRHCAVSAPKRCKAKDGILRKSYIMHLYISTITGTLVAVCRKTFTDVLGVRYGRIKGVVTRYIESKSIPTENRGGNRQSGKFHKKFQSVYNFLSSLQGTIFFCVNCGARRNSISAEQDVKHLWLLYNSKTSHDFRVLESYFRNVFLRHFNICFGEPHGKEKNQCNKCANKSQKERDKSKIDGISEKELLELKLLEMSYPPGEHYLFAPLPSNRDPITSKVWRDGDRLEENSNNIRENETILSHRQSFSMTTLQSSKILPCTEVTRISMPLDIKSNLNNREHCLRGNFANNNSLGLEHVEQFHQSISNTTHQMLITPSCDSLSKLDHMSQSYTCGNTYLNGIISHQNFQYGNERNVNPTVIVHHPGQMYNNVDYFPNSITHIEPARIQDFPKDLNNYFQRENTNLSYVKVNIAEDHQILSQPVLKTRAAHKCASCKLTFSSDITYHNHRKKHLNKKGLSCANCQKTFTTYVSFYEHTKSHVAKMHKCPMCDLGFNYSINLEIHMERQHQIQSSDQT